MERDKLADCVHLMMSALRAHRSMSEQYVNKLGIHHSQHRILMYLSKISRAPSQKELAAEFNVSPAAVAVAIKKLEKGGYIARMAFDGDMRQNRIEITQSGRDIIEKSRSIFHSVDGCMFENFSDDEIDEFHSMLLRIHNNITGEER